MGIQTKEGIRYFTFDSFYEHGITHGIFMRHGGVSPAPWNSLNLGGSNGDARDNVIENRKRIFDRMGRAVESLYDVWQVHSDVVVTTHLPRPLDQKQIKADAILTDRKDVTLFMRFADCVPIFLVDPLKHVVGVVHAGWQGTVQQIISKTIKKMADCYDSRPENICAGIGPSICVHCYEVKADVIQQVEIHLGQAGKNCIVHNNGSTYLDLQQANFLQLRAAGVEKVELSDVCTACNAGDWFSHRAEKGSTGRAGALIAL